MSALLQLHKACLLLRNHFLASREEVVTCSTFQSFVALNLQCTGVHYNYPVYTAKIISNFLFKTLEKGLNQKKIRIKVVKEGRTYIILATYF